LELPQQSQREEQYMTVAERLYRWNRWYDGLPQEWRFHFILWPLIALGAVNMMLSLSIRFPFGLLVLIGVLCVAAVRVPYTLGWITPAEALPTGEPGTQKLEIGGAGADWLVGLNRRYEAMPEERRFWVFPAILAIAGAVNMLLTINNGFPFGLIFLIVLLAVIVMRAPYAYGWLRPPSSGDMPAPALRHDARITDTRSPAFGNAHSGEPAASTMPAPPVVQREVRPVDPNETTVPAGDTDAARKPSRDPDGAASSSPTVSAQPALDKHSSEARYTSSPPVPTHDPSHEANQT